MTDDDWAGIAVGEWPFSRSLDADPSAQHRVCLGTTGNRLYRAEPFRPVLVLGPQRSHKTSGIAVPALLEWDGPALVTSVRRDVLDDSFDWRNTMGAVAVFDPSGSLEGTRYASFRRSWNPLDHCKTWDDCIRMSLALTEAGRLGALSEGNFWFGLASQFLAPLLWAASANGYQFSDVVRWAKTKEDFEVRALLQAAGNEPAITSAENAWGMEDRARSSVYATLWASFRVFDYDSTASSDAESLDVKAFLRSPADTLFICAPPDEQQEYRPLFTALVRTVLRDAYRENGARSDTQLDEPHAPNGGAHSADLHATSVPGGVCPLLVLLDEAGNIAALEGLDGLATTAAGTYLQLVSIFHDVSQMEGVYGSESSRSILNNHSAVLVLPGVRDIATLDYVERLLRGERVGNAKESQWSGPRPVRSMRRGETLLIYENLRPILLSLRSKFNDVRLRERVRFGSASGARHDR